MGKMKRHAEDLAERLVKEWARRIDSKPTPEMYDAAFSFICTGVPHADEDLDSEWALRWRAKHLKTGGK